MRTFEIIGNTKLKGLILVESIVVGLNPFSKCKCFCCFNIMHLNRSVTEAETI